MADGLITSAPDGIAGSLVANVVTGTSNNRQTVHRALRNVFTGSTLVGTVMVLCVIVLAVGAPWFALYDPNKQDVLHSLAPPAFLSGGSWSHPLGTDALGRDLWARIVLGLRTSLLVSIPAVILGAGLGVCVGMLAGYFGGKIDTVLMRLTDVQMAFPFIILAIAILSVTSPSPGVLIVVLSLSAWPIYARVTRSIVMVDGQSEYVLAARSMGAGHTRIILRYLLRNLLISVAVLSTLDIATMIVLEALLSFLGMGIQPPTPSLGNVMADGKEYLVLGVWWIATLPGIVILFTLFGLNLMGDGLQSKLDPRLRRL